MNSIRKFIPCSSHDIAKLEQWLEEMAKDGLRLIKLRSEKAVFEQTNQTEWKYHLIVADKAILEDAYIAEMESLGWKFILKYNKVLYFITDDLSVPAPERDPLQVIQQVKNVKRRTFLLMIGLMLVTYIMIFTIPLDSIIRVGSWKVIFIVILNIALILKQLYDNLKLGKWTRLVRDGLLHTVDFDWRTGSIYSRFINFIAGMITAVILIGGFVNIFVDFDNMNRVRISEYHGEAVLPTLEELYPQYQFGYTEFTYIEHDSDLLSPVVETVEYWGQAFDNGIELGHVNMDCLYYQTIDKRVAQQLAKGYMEEQVRYGAEEQIINSNPHIDVAYAYQSEDTLIMVLAHDKKMLYITLWSFPNGFLQDPDELLGLFKPVLE